MERGEENCIYSPLMIAIKLADLRILHAK